MTCQGSGSSDEYAFVAEIVNKRRDVHTCCGPLVRQGFSASRLAGIEECFDSAIAHDLLWAGFDPEPVDAMYFTLCALHWMEIACLVSLRGHQYDDAELRMTGTVLLMGICATLSWDPKEIANAFTWQQVRLT